MGRTLGNWIEAYREFTAGTESPAVFHLWVAIGTLAAAAQRKVKMESGHYDIHSNMYIILVAPPGKARKSTALRVGKRLLAKMKEFGQPVNFSTQASSVAALVKQMSSIPNREHQSLTAFSSELGSLLGSKSIEMTDFLVDIYDCEPDWDKQTLQRGLEKISHPWFNLLGATTPQWLGDNLSKTAVEGGFVARTVFVYEDTRLLVAFPELTPEQRALERALIKDLAHIATIKGSFVFSEEGKKYYKDWYEDPNRLAGNTDYRIGGYYERKHIHVLKVAMALSLAAKDELVLLPEEIKAAVMLLDSIEPGMHKAFSAVGGNIQGTVLERLRSWIRERGKVTYKQVLFAFINDAKQETIDELITSLVDMGEISWHQKQLVSSRWVAEHKEQETSAPAGASNN